MVKYSLGPVHRRHWKRILIPVIVLAAIAGVLFLIIHAMSSPAVGSLTQTPPNQQAYKPDPYASSGIYNGQYISFTYPAHFKKVPSKLTGDVLETVEYVSTDQSARHIDVGVYRGDVSSDSGVTYRRQHPELYKETSSQQWIEFTRLDGTEDTFFIQHNGLEATVSATAPNANLSGEALFVASGMKWKQ